MAVKNIYVSGQDEDVWTDAAAHADKTGTSLSRVVTEALGHYLDHVDDHERSVARDVETHRLRRFANDVDTLVRNLRTAQEQ